jgi:hypothetical protein
MAQVNRVKAGYPPSDPPTEEFDILPGKGLASCDGSYRISHKRWPKFFKKSFAIPAQETMEAITTA